MKRKNINRLLITSILSLSFVTSCSSNQSSTTEEVQQDVLVESVDFKTELESIHIGYETFVTNVRVYPENATNKELTWSIEDPSILSFNNGTIKGLKAGTTKIIASTTDGSNVKKELPFTVKGLEKPSQWEVENEYCFYVENSFTPEITFYPNSPYIDKSVNFEIIEGEDVLKIVDGKVGAYKKGSGKVRITSASNPELSTVITCVADDDLFAKYSYGTNHTLATYSLVSKKYDRVSVIDFKSQIKKGLWPALIVNLDREYSTKEALIRFDTRLVNGEHWFSLRLAKDNNVIRNSEVNGEANGGFPVKDSWTTNTFNYTNMDETYNQILITMNSDSEYQNDPTTTYTEMVFDDLRFVEIAENPTAMSLKQSEYIIPLHKTASLVVNFEPEIVRNDGLTYEVKPGSESIVSVSNGLIYGLAKGTGFVTVTSVGNPNLSCEAKVVVSDDYLVCLEERYNSGVQVTTLANQYDKEIVTSISGAYTNTEDWPGIMYKLPETLEANKVTVTVDTYLVSGLNWMSISLWTNEGKNQIQEIGANPIKGEWSEKTFTFTASGNADTIFIRVNTLDKHDGADKVQILLSNLRVTVR